MKKKNDETCSQITNVYATKCEIGESSIWANWQWISYAHFYLFYIIDRSISMEIQTIKENNNIVDPVTWCRLFVHFIIRSRKHVTKQIASHRFLFYFLFDTHNNVCILVVHVDNWSYYIRSNNNNTSDKITLEYFHFECVKYTHFSETVTVKGKLFHKIW